MLPGEDNYSAATLIKWWRVLVVRERERERAENAGCTGLRAWLRNPVVLVQVL